MAYIFLALFFSVVQVFSLCSMQEIRGQKRKSDEQPNLYMLSQETAQRMRKRVKDYEQSDEFVINSDRRYRISKYYGELKAMHEVCKVDHALLVLYRLTLANIPVIKMAIQQDTMEAARIYALSAQKSLDALENIQNPIILESKNNVQRELSACHMHILSHLQSVGMPYIETKIQQGKLESARHFGSSAQHVLDSFGRVQDPDVVALKNRIQQELDMLTDQL